MGPIRWWGQLVTTNGNKLQPGSVLVDPLLLDRLGISVGDPLVIGVKQFTVADSIDKEPDALASGIAFGPRVIMGLDDLSETDLLQPGVIVRWISRVKMAGTPSLSQIDGVIEQIREAYPDAGWRIRSRANAAQGLARNIDRFAAFPGFGRARLTDNRRGWHRQCGASLYFCAPVDHRELQVFGCSQLADRWHLFDADSVYRFDRHCHWCLFRSTGPLDPASGGA